MKMHIELCGVPGAGKSTACAALVADAGSAARALGREAAMLRCLRRRDDGLLKNTLKRLPGWVWKRIMDTAYAMDELRRFMADHIALSDHVMHTLHARALSPRDADIVWGAFMRTFVEYELARRFLRDDETLIMDEGFAHRAFTLFGYLDEALPEADLERYAALVPLPDRVILVDTPPPVCAERLAARPARPFQFPIQLADMTPERRVAQLEHGAACLRRVADALEARGAHVVRIDTSQPGAI
jgi:hypothetical protein